jgi:hypothetical protein
MENPDGKLNLKPGINFGHQVKVKNQDGSILSVDKNNISDPQLEGEIELILNAPRLTVNGDIVKKK